MPRHASHRSPDTGQMPAADTVAVSARGAAALLGVNERTVRRAILRGDLRAAKQSGVFVIDRDELERFANGRHRRRGIARRPVARSQLTVIPWPGRADSPPAAPPLPLTPLIGRTREIAEVRAALLDHQVRLLTLTGPGGVGKTRVAIQSSVELGQAFADGVGFVPLAALRDHKLLAPTIVQALGLRGAGRHPPAERLDVHLRHRQLLLVLDTFEHLLPAGPLLVAWLVAAPQLRILVTSRSRLQLSGEHDLPIPPLALPDPDRPFNEGDVETFPATRLFAGRARAVDPGFAVTDENAADINAICHRLDGLPLAIELAAARSRTLPPAALLARLERRLPLLAGGPRDLPARLRTMRDALTWSYELLSAAEQALFRRLAVFAGGFTPEAADAVAEEPAALDGIEALVGHSLLTVESGAGEPRYGMLDTIREFGLEQLAAAGEEETVRDAHAASFLGLAEEAEPHLIGPDQGIWLDRLEVEQANLRAAFDWVLTRDGEAALRMGAALWRFWSTRDYLSEARDHLARVLAAVPVQVSAVRARVLLGAGTLALSQTDFAAAAALLKESLAISRQLGDGPGIAAALGRLGKAAHWQGETDRAVACYEESLALRRDLGDAREIAMALSGLGLLRRNDGDLVVAAASFEEALALLRGRGNDEEIAYTLQELGVVIHAQGDQPRAAALLEEALALFRQLDDREGTIHCLEAIATVAVACQVAERAARLYGAAAALRAAYGVSMPPTFKAAHERNIADAHTGLDEAAFVAAWAAGEAMSMDAAASEGADVLREIAAGAPSLPSRSKSPAHPDLTPRELDVLRLLIEGKTNPEIAAALFIGRQTVLTHMRHILAKLNVETRTAAVARAIQRGLV